MRVNGLLSVSLLALSLSSASGAKSKTPTFKIPNCEQPHEALMRCCERGRDQAREQLAKTVKLIEVSNGGSDPAAAQQAQQMVDDEHGACTRGASDSFYFKACTPKAKRAQKCEHRRNGAIIEATEACQQSAKCSSDGVCQLDEEEGVCRGPLYDADCRRTDSCQEKGHCSLKGNACVLASDYGCRKLPACEEKGHCSFKGNACVLASDYGCRKLPACKAKGHCSFIDGECRPGTNEECRLDPACEAQGLCSFQEGRCYPGNDSECRRSPGCVDGGLCAHRLLTKECSRSPGCVDGGLCAHRLLTKGKLKLHQCVPSSKEQGKLHQRKLTLHQCVPSSTGECRKSSLCRAHGACGYIEGKCRPTSVADCLKSPACQSLGFCDYRNGGCGPTKKALPPGFEFLPATRIVEQVETCTGRGRQKSCTQSEVARELPGFYIQRTEFTEGQLEKLSPRAPAWGWGKGRAPAWGKGNLRYHYNDMVWRDSEGNEVRHPHYSKRPAALKSRAFVDSYLDAIQRGETLNDWMRTNQKFSPKDVQAMARRIGEAFNKAKAAENGAPQTHNGAPITFALLKVAKDNPKNPLVGRGLNEVLTIANKLSEAENLEPCYDLKTFTLQRETCRGYRLPSRAEWRRANKPAATQTARNIAEYEQLYLNPSTPPVSRSALANVKSVAQKKPNAFGLYDMDSNAVEWLCPGGGKGHYGKLEGLTSTGHRVRRDGKAGETQSVTVPKKYWASKTDDYFLAYPPEAAIGFRLVRSVTLDEEAANESDPGLTDIDGAEDAAGSP